MEEKKLKICLVSLNQKFEDKSANREKVEDILNDINKYNLDIIIFPEMTLTGYSLNTELSEPWENSKSLKFFIEQSKKSNTSIIFGLSIKENNSYKNRACFIDNKGNVLLFYDKIHPFSYAGEEKIFDGGSRLSFAKYKDFSLALTICYDLRFPEIYSLISTKADIIVNIANWPSKRLEHWKVLLQARAIENQVFIVGVNRTGKDLNNDYQKSSMLIYPSGEICKPIISEGEIDIYEIDKYILETYRSSFPTYKDKKLELYYKLYEGYHDAFKG